MESVADGGRSDTRVPGLDARGSVDAEAVERIGVPACVEVACASPEHLGEYGSGTDAVVGFCGDAGWEQEREPRAGDAAHRFDEEGEAVVVGVSVDRVHRAIVSDPRKIDRMTAGPSGG